MNHRPGQYFSRGGVPSNRASEPAILPTTANVTAKRAYRCHLPLKDAVRRGRLGSQPSRLLPRGEGPRAVRCTASLRTLHQSNHSPGSPVAAESPPRGLTLWTAVVHVPYPDSAHFPPVVYGQGRLLHLPFVQPDRNPVLFVLSYVVRMVL